jgi:hypothetical protein
MNQLVRIDASSLSALVTAARDSTAAGIETKIGNYSFRAPGITAYLKNGGTLEAAVTMAAHASTHDAAS